MNSADTANMLANVTFCIKTFERPLYLNRLITSIKKYYPEAKIMVADDGGGEPVEEYYPMPYDSGLSAGRNLLVRNVKTKYFVLLDDDYEFCEDTKIERFYHLIETTDLDIIGGAVKDNGTLLDYYGKLVKTDDVVEYTREVEDKGDYFLADIMPNFFMSKPDVYWDEHLKTTEHFDFFYRLLGKKKIGFTKEVVISHSHPYDNPPKYNKIRFANRDEYLQYILKKHNLKKLVSFAETITL